MLKAQDGDIVRVHYTLTMEDDNTLDSPTVEQSFEFMIGRGSVIPAFENALVGMAEGETKSLAVSPEKAYGWHRDDLVYVIEKHLLPPDIHPEVGITIELDAPDGNKIDAVITYMDDFTVKCDANHEFAGKTLFFEIRLLKIIRPG